MVSADRSQRQGERVREDSTSSKCGRTVGCWRPECETQEEKNRKSAARAKVVSWCFGVAKPRFWRLEGCNLEVISLLSGPGGGSPFIDPGAGHGARVLAYSVVTDVGRHCRPPTPEPPPYHSVSTEVPVIYGVFCVQRQKTSCFTVFRALGRQGISSWRCSKASIFTWFWALEGGPGRTKWHLKIVST